MKIIDSMWFNAMGNITPIGIVMAELSAPEQQEYDANGELSAWIGDGTGRDEDVDVHLIVKTGARFPVEAAKVLFGVP